MKKIIIKYGLYSIGVLISFNLIMLAIFGTEMANYSAGELLGYGAIIASLVFVYFGIRQYKFSHGSSITFSKSLLIGSLISLFPAIAFGAYNVVYTEIIDPEFVEKYYEHNIMQMKASLPPAEFKEYEAEMESQKELFASPVVQFLVMAVTVLIIGFIMSIISSVILSDIKKRIRTSQ